MTFWPVEPSEYLQGLFHQDKTLLPTGKGTHTIRFCEFLVLDFLETFTLLAFLGNTLSDSFVSVRAHSESHDW